jgi:FAD/FMN-containing dehydrogenase
MRKFSLTSDNLISVDLVTADGRFVTASETENADLFWGVRGGGGNFGVATSFTFRLHNLGPTVVGGAAFWPAAQAADVLRFARDYLAKAPDELTTLIGFLTAPPAPFLPEELHGQRLVSVAVVYAGDVEDGMRVVQPIKDFGPPAADVIGPIPYVAHQQLFDWIFPAGNRYYIKSELVDELSDGFIDAFVPRATNPSSPLSLSTIQHYGGVVARRAADATAYGHREANYAITLGPGWTDPAEDDMHIAWVREFFDAMQPFAHGVYVNFLSQEDTDRVRAAYAPEIYDRLQALKRKYDPTNLFRVNHNIAP